LKTRGFAHCKRSRAKISFTAGIIFASTKLSLTTRFFSIYLITQSISVSALNLKRIKGVFYKTALLIKHKIQQIMKERDDSKPRDADIFR
jgi:hypothetical protein